jgi:hypothetical protein
MLRQCFGFRIYTFFDCSTATPQNRNSLSISGAVAHIPGANIKEFLVTILREAKRPQSQLFEPGGRVLGLQWSER